MFAPKLGDILVRDGIISVQDKKTIAQTAGQESAAFAKGVLALGIMDEEELAAYIEEHTQFQKASQELIEQADPQVQSLMDSFIIKQLEVLPLKLDGNRLLVAMIDPLDQDTLRQVEFFSGKTAVPLITTPTVLGHSLKKLIKDYQPRVSHLEAFLQAYQPRRNHSQPDPISQEVDPDVDASSDLEEAPTELTGDHIENIENIENTEETSVSAETPVPHTAETPELDKEAASPEAALADAASAEAEAKDDSTVPVTSAADDGPSPVTDMTEMAASEPDFQPSETQDASLSDSITIDSDAIASEQVEATPEFETATITTDETVATDQMEQAGVDTDQVELAGNELDHDDLAATVDATHETPQNNTPHEEAPLMESTISNENLNDNLNDNLKEDFSANEAPANESSHESSIPDENIVGAASASPSTFHQLNNRLNHATIQLSLAQTQSDLDNTLRHVLAACNFNHVILCRILSENPLQLEELITSGDQFNAFAETVLKSPDSSSSDAAGQLKNWQGPWSTTWRNMAEVVDANALKLIQGTDPHHDCQVAKFQAKWGEAASDWLCLTSHTISPKQFLMFWDTLEIVLKKYIALSYSMSHGTPSES